jgi:hypothetical protein
MSSQLVSIFMANAPIHLDGEATPAEGENPLLWKVVLRTGTWKLRPGPGGQKIPEPLKIVRDKAPKGHISMSELVKSFQGDDKGPAKENVTLTQVHADGTTSDGGFVRKLAIQDVAGEDGSGVKESLLWAGIEVTDSDLNKKLVEKSIVGVSGGILFDYERTEDAKKFPQILSHVMATNSPWINGTGGFQNKLPDGVMASEPEDLPIAEGEFASRETERVPQFPSVQLDEPPAPGKATSKVVWKPEQGLHYVRGKVQSALEEWRKQLMASIPATDRYNTDWPFYRSTDVSLDSETSGTALITSGYDSETDTWVARFKFDDDREVEIEPFLKWTPAKQEWVAASEEPHITPPPASPAGRDRPPHQSVGYPAAVDPRGLGLREAQVARAERMRLGITPTKTGGPMGRLIDSLSGVELSDEQRELLRAEDERIARLETSEAARRQAERSSEVVAYCGTTDGQTPGLLDQIGLGDPGVKKYVRNALLSDDGGTAIELSEHLDNNQKTAGVPKTATELLKGFIDLLPKKDDGKVSLSEQARRLPDDPKPPEDATEKPKDAKAEADALLAEMRAQGLGGDLLMPSGKEA